MIFDDRYEVFLADTPESKSLHYQLRYKVYCEETGWEPGRLLVREKLEYDDFDVTSHHFLVRDRLSLEWVGGLRLIEQPFCELPISKFCRIDERPRSFIEQGECVEVSRLFVLPDFRCGKQHSAAALGASGLAGSAHYYEIMLGLIRAAREFGLKNGVISWYFLVEPALARIIKRVGIDLNRCGPGVRHKGLRYPYSGEIVTCFERIFSGPDDIGLMFSKANTFAYCSRLDRKELRERVPESSTPGVVRKLAIA